MKKPRLLCVLLAAALSAGMLAGCGQPAPAASSAPPESQPASDAQTPLAPAAEEPAPEGKAAAGEPLRVMLSEGGSAKALEKGIADFVDETGQQVEVLKYPYAEVREKQMLDVTSQTGDVDIIVVDGPIWLSEFGAFLDPLEPYIQKDSYDTGGIIPSMLDMFKQDGKLYGLPVRIGGWVLIYRTDLFEQKGLTPPKTMEEFREAAMKLTDGGVYGFTAALKQTNYLVAQWAPFLYSFGGDFLDGENKKAAFNSAQGIAATQFMVDLFQKDKVISPSAIDYEQNNLVTAMQQGIAAMAITYSPYYLEMMDKEKSPNAGKFSVAPMLPYAEGSGLQAGITEISGWGMGVNKYGKNKDAAWELLKYMSSDNTQKTMAVEYNNSPVASAVYNDPGYLSIYKEAPAVLSSLQGAKTRPGIPQWTEIEDILAKELSAAVGGVKSVEQALSDAEGQVNSILGE